jgi:dTDP-glucose pyrophosphorylase
MNVLILAGGQADFNSDDGNYPLCLAEIDGTPLIQHLVQACVDLGPIHFIVALRELDIREYHLDNIVSLLAPAADIVSVADSTRGAACTALLATGYIDNDDELLIINGNEILDVAFSTIVSSFKNRELDAGTVTFSSIHPRYSYVRLSQDDLVVEAAEKRPISRHATVGFYWFARGKDFVRGVQSMIYKDASVNDTFYICPVLNELVLAQARIGIFPIETNKYHPLKTARQLMQVDVASDQRGRA